MDGRNDGMILEELLIALRGEEQLESQVVLEIVERAERILMYEPNTIHITGKVVIVGDLHGQFYDFLNILDMVEDGDKLLFLGDYVDRGYNSVELILYALLLKLKCPEKVFLLRGNHENRSQTSAYGFMDECVEKYSLYVYWKICDLFDFLPIASVINGSCFCVHGGIVPGLSLGLIDSTDRTSEFSDIAPVMWSDPCDDIDYFKESQRGAGCLFGAAALEEFLQNVKCDFLVRSHQLVYDGVLESLNGRCITVWSAPNYCYKCKNIAAIMVVSGQSHKYIFFDAATEQYKV